MDKILKICDLFKKNYYIQNFELSENVRDKTLKSFSQDELEKIEIVLKERFPNVIIRGEWGDKYV